MQIVICVSTTVSIDMTYMYREHTYCIEIDILLATSTQFSFLFLPPKVMTKVQSKYFFSFLTKKKKDHICIHCVVLKIMCVWISVL